MAAESQHKDYTNSSEQMIFLTQVLSVINSMPEVQRSAILLVTFEGHSIRVAATILGIPQGTLMSKLARARSTLRKTLDHAETLASTQV